MPNRLGILDEVATYSKHGYPEDYVLDRLLNFAYLLVPFEFTARTTVSVLKTGWLVPSSVPEKLT